MIVIPFHLQLQRGARYCARALAAVSLLATTTGCEKAKRVFGEFSETATGNTNVPAEIADACVIVRLMPAHMNLVHGFKLSTLAQTLEKAANAQSPTWEKSHRGYIWRFGYRNDLQQTDHAIAIEFTAPEPLKTNPYPGHECGPKLLRAEAGIEDGVPMQEAALVALFQRTAIALQERGADGEQPISATAAVTSPRTETFAPLTDTTVSAGAPAVDAAAAAADAAARASEAIEEAENGSPISEVWLRGTWGPAEYNPGNNPNASCETDGTVTFNANGTYADGGSEGRYRTDGRSITYFNRIMVDIAEQTRDRSQYNRPLTTRAIRVDQNTMRENGTLLRRCRS